MHIKYLSILKCPRTGDDLILSDDTEINNEVVENGTLVGVEHGVEYPIVKFVPRFVEQELYSSSFGYEWRRWPKIQFEAENKGKIMEGFTKRMFHEITEIDKREIKDKKIVEFGCGAGRFLDLIKNDSSFVVGLDMSISVEVARENFEDSDNILIVQGDVLNPPFKEGVFDVAYSIGVFHHTPNPQKAFVEMSNTVKSGGLTICCVYPKIGLYSYFSVHMYRFIINSISKLSGKLARQIAIAYSFFSGYVLYYFRSFFSKIPIFGKYVNYIFERYLFVIVNYRDIKWRILDVYDAITPRYASTHTESEIENWFRNQSFQKIKKTSWCDTTFRGIKK